MTFPDLNISIVLTLFFFSFGFLNMYKFVLGDFSPPVLGLGPGSSGCRAGILASVSQPDKGKKVETGCGVGVGMSVLWPCCPGSGLGAGL